MPSYGGGGNTSNPQKAIDANNAKYQAEAQAYANSKGISIPSDFAVMSGMVILPTKSYYKSVRDVGVGRDTARDREYASKTPQYAVDQYVNNKNQFFQTLIGAQAKKAIFQKNLPIMGQDLQKYIKYAASAGVPASIVNTAIKQEQDAARGSSGGGLGGFFNDVFGGVGDIVTSVYQSVSNTLAKAEDVVKEEVLPNPIFQIAMAYYMPGIASSLGPYLTAVPAAYQTAVAGALASTAVQTAQGVPFETALKNATVNAITNTGAPVVADYILPYAGSTQVADALTSIGASAAKTAAMGGTKEDIERNMAAALTGSALTSSLQEVDVSRDTSRVAGAAAGGAVVGGTEGAIGGALGELGGQAARDEAAKNKALEDAKKGIASADTGTVSDSGQQLGEVVVTGKTEPSITDTSIIISGTPIFADSPRAANVKPPTGFTVMPIQLAENKPAGSYYDIEQNAWLTPIEPTPPAAPETVAEPSLPTTTVTGKAESGITDTSIITPTGPITDREVMGAMQPPTSVPPVPVDVPSLPPVTVTGKQEPTTVQDTDITLPETTVIGKKEEDTLPKVTVKGEKEEEPIAKEPTVDEKGKPYRPNLFIYGGTKPSTLSQTLGTTLAPSTTTGTSVGLGGRGEIESKESGKKRQSVWNEESLRLKDALGL
jgi:hypothetical protein